MLYQCDSPNLLLANRPAHRRRLEEEVGCDVGRGGRRVGQDCEVLDACYQLCPHTTKLTWKHEVLQSLTTNRVMAYKEDARRLEGALARGSPETDDDEEVAM